MRKTVLLTLLVLSLIVGRSTSVSAQTTLTEGAPPLTAIDFSGAEISQAGPDSLYIRNVVLPDDTVSIILSLDDDGAWQVAGVVPDEENLLPSEVVLEFATISSLDARRLEVDGIIYDGRILSGVLDLNATGVSSFSDITRRGTLSEREIAYPETLRDLLLGRKIEEHEAEIAAVRTEYEARLSDLQERYQVAVAEREALRSTNETLAGQIQSLRQDNEVLRGQVSELEAQLAAIADSESSEAAQSTAYLTELRALRGEIASLRTQIDSLQDALASREVRPVVGGPEDGGATTGGPEAADAITGADEGDSIDEPLPYREGPAGGVTDSRTVPDIPDPEESFPYVDTDGTAELIPADERPPSEPSDGSPDEASATEVELRRQIASLRARNAELSAARVEIEAEIRETLLADGYLALLRPQLNQTVLSTFETATAQLGAWRVVGDRAMQRDPEMLFGKLTLPIEQTSETVLYSFDARSTDPSDQWVGFGLHIYVSDVEKQGYGLGRSLLVWLTRDREVYKTDYTYLQLYRSDDDINMGRVMDAVILDPITEFVSVDVLYEPVSRYITVAVNGEEKIRYKTWFDIDEGVEIAVRSLGTAEFRNLEVRSAGR